MSTCTCWPPADAPKEKPIGIAEKNRTISRIFENIFLYDSFLLIGHTYADEDCVGALVAFGLLLRKFHKKVFIYLAAPMPSQLAFFANICNYNKIDIFIGEKASPPRPDTIMFFDVPKPQLAATSAFIQTFLQDPSIQKIELDHHFSADAAHTGDVGYRLTPRASSTCEIIALVCHKLTNLPDVLEKYYINTLYTRNIVLSMLTGILGDARLGNFLRSRRDKQFYRYFTQKFNGMLQEKILDGTKNINSIEEILSVLNSFSDEEKALYQTIGQYKQYEENIAYMILSKEVMSAIPLPADYNLFVGVVKDVTNELADKAPFVGITAYYDPPHISDKIQFRVRCSESARGIDLRQVLQTCNLTDGGGHPGAIAFRLQQTEVTNMQEFLEKLFAEIRKILRNAKLI